MVGDLSGRTVPATVRLDAGYDYMQAKMKKSGLSLAHLDNPHKGMFLAVVGVTLFSLQDVIIKGISGKYPVHEIMFVRGLVAAPAILLIAYVEGQLASMRTRRLHLQLLRASAFLVAFTCTNLALATLPLADVASLFYSAPLFVTALSVGLLGERVGLRGWIAVSTGLVGVVLVMRPGDSMFRPTAVLPVLAALFYAIGSVTTRRLGRTESGSSMAFYTTAFQLPVGVAMGLAIGNGRLATGENPSLQFLLRSWAYPSWIDLGLLVLCGAIAALGFYSLSQAYRVTRATVVAPLEYIAVPLGVLWGFLFWKDLPRAHVVVGTLLILASGMYVLRRNRTGSMERQGCDAGSGV